MKSAFVVVAERLHEKPPALGGLHAFWSWLSGQQYEGRYLTDLLEEEREREGWTEDEANARLCAAMASSGRYTDHGDGEVSLVDDPLWALAETLARYDQAVRVLTGLRIGSQRA